MAKKERNTVNGTVVNGTADHGHSIKIAAQRTGLSSHVIRVWERRYEAVKPRRTETNRRLYSDDDVDRLRLLAQATDAGHAIGNIAGLSDDELRSLIAEDRGTVRRKDPAPGGDPAPHLERAVEAAADMDAERLRGILEAAALDLPQLIVLEEVVVPLMHRIGDMWYEGTVRVVHEHTAYAVVCAFVNSLKTSYAPSEDAPVVVVATPAGQLHELGALIVATTAAADGWRPAYLGPSLPVEEIAKSAEMNDAIAVALSVVYPHDDPTLGDDIRKLRRLLPDKTWLLVGGRAAFGYLDVIEEVDARYITDLKSLRSTLAEARS